MKKKIVIGFFIFGVLALYGCGKTDVTGKDSKTAFNASTGKYTTESESTKDSKGVPVSPLEVEKIEAVTVTLLPSDQSITLSKEEISTFVELYNSVVLYKEDQYYKESVGQWVLFEVKKIDGTTFQAVAYSPFFIINGKGYQAEYSACEKLSEFANQLLDRLNE